MNKMYLSRMCTVSVVALWHANFRSHGVCAGHVLISPLRVEPKFSALKASEVADLWQLAQKVSACMQANYNADAMSLVIQVGFQLSHSYMHCCKLEFNTRRRRNPEKSETGNSTEQQLGSCIISRCRCVLVQDGPAAGQTVPHVHVHCLPRHFADYEPNDKVYDRIDQAEADESTARQRCCLPMHPTCLPLVATTCHSMPLSRRELVWRTHACACTKFTRNKCTASRTSVAAGWLDAHDSEHLHAVGVTPPPSRTCSGKFRRVR